jgi:hypothetical protein
MQKKNCAEIDTFTACTAPVSLLETNVEAAEIGAGGDRILLSPACSSFDRFQILKQCDERICLVKKSISWGRRNCSPKMHGQNRVQAGSRTGVVGRYNFSFRGFLRENHGTNQPVKSTSQNRRD